MGYIEIRQGREGKGMEGTESKEEKRTGRSIIACSERRGGERDPRAPRNTGVAAGLGARCPPPAPPGRVEVRLQPCSCRVLPCGQQAAAACPRSRSPRVPQPGPGGRAARPGSRARRAISFLNERSARPAPAHLHNEGYRGRHWLLRGELGRDVSAGWVMPALWRVVGAGKARAAPAPGGAAAGGPELRAQSAAPASRSPAPLRGRGTGRCRPPAGHGWGQAARPPPGRRLPRLELGPGGGGTPGYPRPLAAAEEEPGDGLRRALAVSHLRAGAGAGAAGARRGAVPPAPGLRAPAPRRPRGAAAGRAARRPCRALHGRAAAAARQAAGAGGGRGHRAGRLRRGAAAGLRRSAPGVQPHRALRLVAPRRRRAAAGAADARAPRRPPGQRARAVGGHPRRPPPPPLPRLRGR